MGFEKLTILNENINCCKIAKNYFATVDDNSTVMVYSKDSTLTEVLNINQLAPFELYHGNSSSSFDDYILLFKSNEKKTSLLKFNSNSGKKEFIKDLKYSNQTVITSKFHRNKDLVAIGYEDGTCKIYHTKTGQLYCDIEKLKAPLSSVCLSKSGTFLAYFSYECEINIFNIYTNKVIFSKTRNSYITSAAFYNNSKYMLLATSGKRIVVYDFINNVDIRFLASHQSQINQIYINKNDTYAIYADKLGNIFFCDLTDNSSESIVIASLKTLIIDIVNIDGKIHIVKNDGEIFVFNIDILIDNMITSINNQEFETIKQTIKDNHFLNIKLIKNKINQIFEDKYQKAISLIEQQNIQEAKYILDPFIGLENYKTKIDYLIKNRDKINDFLELIKKNNFYSAYLLSQNYPVIKSLDNYNKLVQYFENILYQIALSLLKSANPNLELKKKIDPFLKIFEINQMYQEIAKNPTILIKIKNAIDKKDAETLKKLILTNKWIEKTSFFINYKNKRDSLKTNFLKLINSKQYIPATSLGNVILKDYPELKESLKDEFTLISQMNQYKEAIQKKNISIALTLLCRNQLLNFDKNTQILLSMLDKEFMKAIELINTQDFLSFQKHLNKFYKNNFFQKRVISFYKIYYLESLTKIKDKSDEEWKEFYKNYLQRFGLDSDIIMVIKQNKHEKIVNEVKKYARGQFELFEIKENLFKIDKEYL